VGPAPADPDGAGRLGALALLLDRPSASAVLTDFDGTLAPIVADPDLAAPLPGVPDVLGALARRFRTVGVVSGRPVAFLVRHLAAAGPAVALVGAYGLEWVEAGEIRHAPEAAPWRAAAAGVVSAARAAFAGAPVGVEDKGASVTLHWRRAPEYEDRVRAFAAEWAARSGLDPEPGRRAVELRPPVGIDKGSAVERLAAGAAAACFVGDDAGDLAAFAALDRLARAGTRTVAVAVADEESPAALVARADVVVPGPLQALGLLEALAAEAGAEPG